MFRWIWSDVTDNYFRFLQEIIKRETQTRVNLSFDFDRFKEDVIFSQISCVKTNNSRNGYLVGAAEWANYLQSDTQPELCSKKLLREISFPKFTLSALKTGGRSERAKQSAPFIRASIDKPIGSWQSLEFKFALAATCPQSTDNDIKKNSQFNFKMRTWYCSRHRAMGSVAWSVRVSHASLKLKPGR